MLYFYLKYYNKQLLLIQIIIDMEIDSCREDKLEAYSLLFNRLRFGFVSKINMDNLKYFSIENQQNEGKIDILININALKRLRNNKNFNYLIMTQYQQIIPLIYFLRGQPAGCKIITTKIMLQIAKIYAQDFYRVIKKKNQIVTVPTYEQESMAYDNYQIKFHIDFSQWAPIYEKQEIDNFIQRCVVVNYAQNFDTQRGTVITAYPSGINIGSAVWLFQNQSTKNKILWVQGISHHNWRACQQFNVDPIHNQINTIVFTSNVLTNSCSTVQDESQCVQFLKKIAQRLSKGYNNRIVLDDFTVIADVINYIYFQMREKLKKLFFTGTSANKMMSYINSYPQFLTQNHKRRIYQDPPVYPFETYELLRDKFISEGTLEQISLAQKIQLKQLIARFTPYMHFQTDFHAYLVEGENQVVNYMFEKFYDISKLQKFFNHRKIQNIICICKDQGEIKNIPDLAHSFRLNLIETKIFIPDENQFKYYTAEGCLPKIACRYDKKNGWLKLSPIVKNFRQLNKDWHLKLNNQLSKLGISVLKSSQLELSTSQTRIGIKNYQLFVESSSQRQLEIIDSFLNSECKIMKIVL